MREDVVTCIDGVDAAEVILEHLSRRHLVQVPDQRIGADGELADIGLTDEKASARLEHAPGLDGRFVLLALFVLRGVLRRDPTRHEQAEQCDRGE